MKLSHLKKTNGKQHYQLNFGIPLWVTRPFEKAAYSWRKFKFWVHPFHCDCCGKRMYVRSPQYEYHPEGKSRLLVENINRKSTICRECLVNELSTKTWEPRFSHSTKERKGSSRYNYRFWSKKKCDVTGKAVRAYKDVEIYPHVDMLFCTIAWNHDYASKEAVIDAVKHGVIRTSAWGIYKQNMAQMNSKRLFIDSKGELL